QEDGTAPRSEPERARPEPVKAAAAPVPSTEQLLDTPETKSGPDTVESDHWVPKAAPKPAAKEPEAPSATPESMKVAMLPKSAPVDNSVDNLLKMANTGKEQMPREGDSWVPKKTAAVSPEVDINKELSRVREEERKK